MFGIGECDPGNKLLVTKYDVNVVNQNPINNGDSKRSVGSINYGLSIHGTSQLRASRE